MHTGQEVIGDVLAVDKSFEPFVLGQGRVPHLFESLEPNGGADPSLCRVALLSFPGNA